MQKKRDRKEQCKAQLFQNSLNLRTSDHSWSLWLLQHGPQEALSLSPWVHPMTEVEYIDINPGSVVMSAPASNGLQRYYRHCINSFDFVENPYEQMSEPTDEDLREIEVEEALDELTDPDKSETIH